MTTPDQPQDVEPDQVKVIFELERDEDGWPPVSGERLWAFDLGDGTYRIDNVPWYVENLAVEDVVAAAYDEDRLLLTAMVEKSEHLTIRLLCQTDDDVKAEAASVAELFQRSASPPSGAVAGCSRSTSRRAATWPASRRPSSPAKPSSDGSGRRAASTMSGAISDRPRNRGDQPSGRPVRTW